MNLESLIESWTSAANAGIGPGRIVAALSVSAATAAFIGLLHKLFYGNRKAGTGIHRTFLLLCPSITALFLTIQTSLPLSLGLVGSLAIIRFRTPVRDPEEVGFLLLAIAGAVACAVSNYTLLAMLLGVSVAALSARRLYRIRTSPSRPAGILTIQAGGDLDEADRLRLLGILETRLPGGHLRGLTLAGGPTKLRYEFPALRGEGLSGLEEALREAVPDVRLKFAFFRSA